MFRFDNFKIGTRLGVGFGVMIASLVGFSFYAIDTMNRLSGFTEKFYRHPYTVSTSVLRIRLRVSNTKGYLNEVILARNETELQFAINQINTEEKLVYEEFAIIDQYFLGDKKDVAEAESFFKQWKPYREEIIRLKKEKKDQEAIAMGKSNTTRHFETLQKHLDDISNFAAKRAELFVIESVKSKNVALQLTIIILISLTIIIAIFSILITRSISVPLQKTVQLNNRLAKGELNISIPDSGQDEVGQLLRSLEYLTDNFKSIVSQVQQVSANIKLGSQNMSGSSVSISAGVTEQATATQEVTVSIQNITGGMRKTADMATSTQTISSQAAEDAEATRQAMKIAVDSMTTIGQQIMFIEDIAAQTNMLALNASIEAVRSQEVNNGFSVVAFEIRKLAKHTREAAAEINQLSHQSISSVQMAGEMLEKLVPSIQETAALVKTISQLNQEHLNSTNQIKQAMQQLDQVTEQNAAMATDLSKMAGTLAHQSDELQRAIAFFQIKR